MLSYIMSPRIDFAPVVESLKVRLYPFPVCHLDLHFFVILVRVWMSNGENKRIKCVMASINHEIYLLMLCN